jgi:uncharacterized membrane protein YphA (DoxX/SURF4 family)
MTKWTALFLILLRLAIGWHFFAEGYHKLEGYWRGPTESVVGKSRPFTSAGYFREGTGPLARVMRKQLGNPDDEALGRLEVQPLSAGQDPADVPLHTRTPPLLDQEWSDYVQRFCDYYGFDDRQRADAKAKLQQTEDEVVRWLTRETVDDSTRTVKKTFQSNTVEVKLPMPERIAEYKDRLHELRDTIPNRLYLMGRDVEGKHLLEVKQEVAGLRLGLLSDLNEYTKNLQKALGGIVKPDQTAQPDKGAAPDPEAPPSKMLQQIDLATMYGLTILGACLLLGLFSRTACVLSAGFLLMTYLCVPPLPWLPSPPNNEGYYAFVNKNLVEMLALLTLATTASGRWFGLDALLHWCCCSIRRRPV